MASNKPVLPEYAAGRSGWAMQEGLLFVSRYADGA
jgi:hypothetical protein